MNKIFILCQVICFILLVHLLKVNSSNVNELRLLKDKIKSLESARIHKSLPAKVQAQKEVLNQNKLQLQTQQISVDNNPLKPEIKQMMDEAIQQHLQKEQENKWLQVIYNNVNMLAKRLKLNDAQMDEFWLVMIGYYDEQQKIQDKIKGLDKTSRDSYKWQLQQLKERTMQKLGSILSNEQVQVLEFQLRLD